VVGVIVGSALRGQGAGRAILAHTVGWTYERGYDPVWVATGPYAAGFYQRCGWELTHTYRGEYDERSTSCVPSWPLAVIAGRENGKCCRFLYL